MRCPPLWRPRFIRRGSIMNLAEDSCVDQKSILLMLAYFIVLCIFLGYSLVTFWPSTPLIVSSLQPNEAPAGEAGTVKISGAGFASGVTVSFDEAAATVDKVESTSVTVKLPQHAAGKSFVVVKNPIGQAVAIPNGFTFTTKLDNPGTPTGTTSTTKDEVSITGVAPTSGPTDGGAPVIVRSE